MVDIALKRPYTFIVMAMLIVLATPFALLNMATDIFPEINIPVVSVIWNYNGLPAQEMGQRIAGQTERGLTTTVSDIEHIESQSLAGITIIKVFFQPTANIQTAIAQVVASVQTQVRQLPPGITPPLVIKYSASSIPGGAAGAVEPDAPRAVAVRRRGEHAASAAHHDSRRRRPVSRTAARIALISVDLDTQALQARGLSPGRRGQRDQHPEPDPAVGHRQVRIHRIHGADERVARRDQRPRRPARCARSTARPPTCATWPTCATASRRRPTSCARTARAACCCRCSRTAARRRSTSWRACARCCRASRRRCPTTSRSRRSSTSRCSSRRPSRAWSAKR